MNTKSYSLKKNLAHTAKAFATLLGLYLIVNYFRK